MCCVNMEVSYLRNIETQPTKDGSFASPPHIWILLLCQLDAKLLRCPLCTHALTEQEIRHASLKMGDVTTWRKYQVHAVGGLLLRSERTSWGIACWFVMVKNGDDDDGVIRSSMPACLFPTGLSVGHVDGNRNQGADFWGHTANNAQIHTNIDTHTQTHTHTHTHTHTRTHPHGEAETHPARCLSWFMCGRLAAYVAVQTQCRSNDGVLMVDSDLWGQHILLDMHVLHVFASPMYLYVIHTRI